MQTTTRRAPETGRLRFRCAAAIILAGSIGALVTVTGAGPTHVHAAGLTASDGATDFGDSVSPSGSSGLVGAYSTTVGANSSQGSAYAFRNLDTATGTITQNVKLIASDGAAVDRFGFAVSQSGTIGLVGAYFDGIGANTRQGSAYVFRNLDTATGTITQNVKLIASDGATFDELGTSVSLSGSIGLVGATQGVSTNKGTAYVFRNLDTATGTITQNVKLLASDGAPSNYFGCSVSQAGSIGLVGAYSANIGSTPGQGTAYVFRSLDTATGTITQNVKLLASDGAANDSFGDAVSLSGSSGLVGALADSFGANTAQGSAYVFRNLNTATGTITQNLKLTASDGAGGDLFGNSVSLSGSIGLVGAYQDAVGANVRQGSAYLFRNLDTATGTITQNVKLTASDGAFDDWFGYSVGLDGDQFVIGALNKHPGTGRGKAYSGSVASVTTLDAGSTSKTISGISFVSQDDWIIGQTTSSNQVILSAGDTANVTAAGKAVWIGKNAGSNNNTLVIAGTLTANQINVGAGGNAGNVLQLGNGGTTGTLSTTSVITNRGSVVFNRSVATTQGTHFGSAAITGTGSVTQTGAGTTTFNAANTYSGNTTIHAGTLKLDLGGGITNSANIVVGDAGSSGTHLDVTTKTGGFSIGAAQTLKGIGQIDGNTTILGTHAPGNSPGRQTFNGNLSYGTGSILNWELTANKSTDTTALRGTDFDGVDVIAGVLSIQSGVTSNLIFNSTGSAVDFTDPFWTSSHSWFVYSDVNLPTLSSGSIIDTIGVSTDSLGATLSEGNFSWNEVGNNVNLRYTAAPLPEPSTFQKERYVMTVTATEGHGTATSHGPKFFVNIESEEYPWDRPTITVLEIRLIGRLPADQPVIEINLEDNTERTLTECEVVELKPGHAFAKKVRYKRG